MIIYMWEFPASFGSNVLPGGAPARDPWHYRLGVDCPDHPWFEHDDRLLRATRADSHDDHCLCDSCAP